MDIDPPDDMNAPSARTILRQLAEDATNYARAEADYLKAEIGERTSHIGPAIAFLVAAIILALSLVIAVVVTGTIWAAIYIGFGWSLLGVAIVMTLIIWLLVRAGTHHLSKATRPWQKP